MTVVRSRFSANDSEGNLRFDAGVNKDNQPRETIWDAENHLSEVTATVGAGSILAKNLFDSNSRKIATTVGGITTIYLYGGLNCTVKYTNSLQTRSFMSTGCHWSLVTGVMTGVSPWI